MVWSGQELQHFLSLSPFSLILDCAHRLEKKRDVSKSLEDEWSRSVKLKQQREEEERRLHRCLHLLHLLHFDWTLMLIDINRKLTVHISFSLESSACSFLVRNVFLFVLMISLSLSLRSAGQLLVDKLTQYKRCCQCKRRTSNCGESNIWKDSHHLAGSQFMT